MTTRRAKRWNGELASLSDEYLKSILEKMQTYGENLQIEFPGHAKTPIYQVINHRGYKMGFDGKHLLLNLNENGNVSDQLSEVFNLEQVQHCLLAPPVAPRRARKGTAKRTLKQDQLEQLEVAKYQYFKANREWLPADIQHYSEEISQSMQQGASAEQAFAAILDQYYEQS